MGRQKIAANGLVALLFLAACSPAPADTPKTTAKAAKAGGHGTTTPHAESPQEELSDMGETVVEESHGHSAKDSEGHAEPNILAPSFPLMLWTALVFGGLYLLLRRFAWMPLVGSLTAREDEHAETLRKAQEARAESEHLLAEHRRQLDATAEQIRQMLEEARRDADLKANAIVEQAKANAEAESLKAKTEIHSAREQALQEIRSKSPDTAASLASKVLGKGSNQDDTRRLVDAARLALSSTTNGHGGRPS